MDIVTLTMAQADAKKKYAPIGGSSGPPVFPRSSSGWMLLNPGNSTNAGVGSEQLVATPTYIPETLTVTRIVFQVVANGPGSGVVLGRYALVSGALVLQETYGVVSGMSGVHTLIGSWTLQAGLPWLAAMSYEGGTTWKVTAADALSVPGPTPLASADLATVGNSYLFQATPAGATLPGNIGAPVFNAGLAVRLALLTT